MIRHSKQIGWLLKQGAQTSTVKLSSHPYFGNTIHSVHPIPVPNDQLLSVGDSFACLQDLRHAAIVGGMFHTNLPVHPAACHMEITADNKVKWGIPTVFVDATNAIKTDHGICIQAQFTTTDPEGEPKLHDFLLDPADVLCVSPYWDPEVARGTRFRDQSMLYASFFVSEAPAPVVAQNVEIFKAYWAKPKQRTEQMQGRYEELMVAAKEALADFFLVETMEGPDPCVDQHAMPCTGPPLPQGTPRRLGWFTKEWIEGKERYNPQSKREFQDLTEMLLKLTRPFGFPMIGTVRHVVSSVMLTDGDMQEFTRQMKKIYEETPQHIRPGDGNTPGFANATKDMLKAIAKTMTPSRAAEAAPPRGDPLFEPRICTGVPDFCLKK